MPFRLIEIHPLKMNAAISGDLSVDPTGMRNLGEFYRGQLLGDCLPFWFPRCVDQEYGGFLHCLDRDGTIVDSDKSVWAQGRMTWMLLEMYNDPMLRHHDQRDRWLAWAESGLQFLRTCCFSGGIESPERRMYFHVTRTGQPIRLRRYAYSESFAAIAWAAHARATGNRESASQAIRLFEFFVDWNFTPGRSPEKFLSTRPSIGLAPRMITIVTAQELRHSIGATPILDQWIDRCIDEIEQLFVKPDLRCVMESVAPDGSIHDHFDGRMLNPGHAIEGAWFILREGHYRRSDRLIELGCRMLRWMWERGWDSEHGGLLYFRDVFGRPLQEYWHEMKFWWPHDEALIATLLAWRLTGDSHFLKLHEDVRTWAFSHFGDPAFGEWYGYLRRDGTPSSSLKGGLWKSAFHHPRALLWCWRLCQPELSIT